MASGFFHHETLDAAVQAILNLYEFLSFNPPSPQYTILASFFLIANKTSTSKAISVSTGTKCLPASRLSQRGEVVHDSHAEVLARRGAMRWFLEEIGRCATNPGLESDWIIRPALSGKYELREDVSLNLYISTVPCKIATTILKTVFR